MSYRNFYNNNQTRSDTHSINATDLTAVIALPTGQILQLATLSMVSLSTHRDAFPVTSLGYVGPKGFTRGHRLTAGTLVFSVFERSAFTKLMNPLEAPRGYVNAASREHHTEIKSAFYNMHADELPPFDIHMIYATPEGLLCYEALLGVIIVDQGSVRSMDLIQIQESYAYMATDHIPIQRLESVYAEDNPTPEKTKKIAVVPRSTGAKTATPPPVPIDPPFSPSFPTIHRGNTGTISAHVEETNPNVTLSGPDGDYNIKNWRDRWRIYTQGKVIAFGFANVADRNGWLVTRDGVFSGDVHSQPTANLTIQVPLNPKFAPVGNYTAIFQDGMIPIGNPPNVNQANSFFSVIPESL